MKLIPVAEEFYSIQGEGYHTGKAAYFVRTGGCDLGCSWCDSPLSHNAAIHPLVSCDDIAQRVLLSGADSVVVTGGEPLLYDMSYLTRLLKERGLKTFLETSGTSSFTGTWDWICLSPKRGHHPSSMIYKMAHELKVVIETEDDFSWAEECRAKAERDCMLFLQPEWSRYSKVIPRIVDYVKKNSSWMISLQSHKFMRIP